MACAWRGSRPINPRLLVLEGQPWCLRASLQFSNVCIPLGSVTHSRLTRLRRHRALIFAVEAVHLPCLALDLVCAALHFGFELDDCGLLQGPTKRMPRQVGMGTASHPRCPLSWCSQHPRQRASPAMACPTPSPCVAPLKACCTLSLSSASMSCSTSPSRALWASVLSISTCAGAAHTGDGYYISLSQVCDWERIVPQYTVQKPPSDTQAVCGHDVGASPAPAAWPSHSGSPRCASPPCRMRPAGLRERGRPAAAGEGVN
jgi:hypothetical protein